MSSFNNFKKYVLILITMSSACDQSKTPRSDPKSPGSNNASNQTPETLMGASTSEVVKTSPTSLKAESSPDVSAFINVVKAFGDGEWMIQNAPMIRVKIKDGVGTSAALPIGTPLPEFPVVVWTDDAAHIFARDLMESRVYIRWDDNGITRQTFSDASGPIPAFSAFIENNKPVYLAVNEGNIIERTFTDNSVTITKYPLAAISKTAIDKSEIKFISLPSNKYKALFKFGNYIGKKSIRYLRDAKGWQPTAPKIDLNSGISYDAWTSDEENVYTFSKYSEKLDLHILGANGWESPINFASFEPTVQFFESASAGSGKISVMSTSKNNVKLAMYSSIGGSPQTLLEKSVNDAAGTLVGRSANGHLIYFINARDENSKIKKWLWVVSPNGTANEYEISESVIAVHLSNAP